jgi:tetraacyldisaccharide 4'-kinase
MANSKTTVAELGDEPFQFYTKFPNTIIAVDADRTNGINQLLKLHPEIDVLLLDDAYQHRKVKASFYTLLTSYEKIFSIDFMLPTGDLREPRGGVKRADVIIVTKCPEGLTRLEQEKLIQKIGKVKQKVFFTSISYDASIFSLKEIKEFSELKKYKILLVTGIAKPKPLLDFCDTQNIDFKHLDYPDHYNFKEEDIENIKDEFSKIDCENKLILTTEKDFVRLQGRLDPLFSLGIKTSFLKNSSEFDSLIKGHIVQIEA